MCFEWLYTTERYKVRKKGDEKKGIFSGSKYNFRTMNFYHTQFDYEIPIIFVIHFSTCKILAFLTLPYKTCHTHLNFNQENRINMNVNVSARVRGQTARILYSASGRLCHPRTHCGINLDPFVTAVGLKRRN